jgi:hypothetical protein
MPTTVPVSFVIPQNFGFFKIKFNNLVVMGLEGTEQFYEMQIF